MKNVFYEISLKDESETYVEIPLAELIGKNLEFQLEQVCVSVLKSFGIEDKSRFPNFKALYIFLTERFRFQEDELEELSPFHEQQ